MAFDAKLYKSTTRQQWQDAAEAWNAWGRLLAEWLGPATETMLDMAAIGPGSRVLDVAAGPGSSRWSRHAVSGRRATSWPRTSPRTSSNMQRKTPGWRA